jgi:hypothetical protein
LLLIAVVQAPATVTSVNVRQPFLAPQPADVIQITTPTLFPRHCAVTFSA